MTEPLLAISGLSRSFLRGGRRFDAVAGADLIVGRGETLALVGPSGSGKSTLARMVLRLIEPDRGTIRFEGTDLLALGGRSLRAARARLQMVFQDPHSAFNPRATVGRVLADPLRIHRIAGRAERAYAIAALLDRVGLPSDFARRPIHEMSGGQRQRVAIARALATKPALIVLDEAVSALDVATRRQILALLIDIQERDRTAYLFVTHDLAAVRMIAHRIAVMDAGAIVETGPARQVVTEPRSPTAQALVAAAPRLAVPAEEETVP
ncbi:ABC transporter ATP-binding protein [Mesorhizobium sp. L-8-10]|uniref:ATP-binding cassette domain-containing protein n=1 Tax=Mesorhizobium sp. L-8-10 TaxID=2744523 RepID=UPI001934EF03|nr:dipeptide/oligopeptide/nickel ABC transporter ATP-binding protein [Mesorhizobium sp. L-8-10]BCH31718.1 ABC transporter ATP-binding protein [Mesorhizobium sp. L-8-10]